MRLLAGILGFLFIATCLFGQKNDPEAERILNDFSKKTKSFKSYKADFEIISENKQNDETSTNKGSILAMGNKYRMNLNQTEIYFDGKNIYNYTPKANEVSVSVPGKKDDDNFINNPSKLFNLYSKDYKYRFLGTASYKGRNCFEIDLYPKDLKKKYSIVKLLIDNTKMELVAAKLIMKSGVQYTLNVISFIPQAPASEKDFTFNPANYKGVEVIDLR